ncbi:IS1634 family transposase [Massilibacteroides vaginae]|uniref:IS1634 family transposase n=1 Tax=Massilibacteroides vaginae TaxID=1673718 RepID=UPI000A1CAE5E|nr:IS1634 family transposase [Massilibacteroides vaginae]
MYVRTKKNHSGSISVVVVSKSSGKYKEVKRFGVADSREGVELLCDTAQKWIKTYAGQQELDFDDNKGRELEETERVINNMDAVLINGTQLLLDRIYDDVGFNRIPDKILRHLVIARVSYPASKLATTEYLKSYYDEDIDLNNIYRYMDKLYNTQQELVQQISVEHTCKIWGGKIGLMFYDVTTLYFETAKTDDLREPGFSKDGKTAESQVVLGLLVSEGGYPLSYSLFNGSQYEDYTMIPMIDDFKERFSLGKDFIVVADSGLMNRTNVDLLRKAGYKYVIGARIKSEGSDVKKWILGQNKEDNHYPEYKRSNSERLILSYSQARAKKDAYNRERGIVRLRKAYKSGKLTKQQVNRRGYNKFLEISKDVEVAISQQKIAEDSKWDGLKGYITNTNLNAEKVIAEYNGLWVVERAFRVSKGSLEMRPMFHFTEHRIEAHVCICFVAYKVYKELERIIKEKNIGMSVTKTLETAKIITTIRVKMPENGKFYTKTLFLTDKHRAIQQLFDITDEVK